LFVSAFAQVYEFPALFVNVTSANEKLTSLPIQFHPPLLRKRRRRKPYEILLNRDLNILYQKGSYKQALFEGLRIF